MPITAYSYIRFSSPEQSRGDSLRRQIEASEKYAKENGLDLDSSLRDIGISGFKGANAKTGALSKFLEMVETGRIAPGSVLLVESLDRLSREDVPKALPRFMALISAGITVVTLGSSPQRYDAKAIESNPYMLIGSLIEMIRANEESKRKSDRVGAAWRQKKADAGKNGPITSRCPAWLKVESGAFAQIPERVRIVQRIFEDSLAGKGKRLIAKELNRAGISPFGKGKGWQYSYIDKILTNPAVIGEYLPHKLENGKRVAEDVPAISGYFPAIISAETFYSAQRTIQKRTGKGGAPSKEHAALFSSLIECAHCGSSVVRITKNRAKGWVYLVCSAASRGAGCKYASWLEKAFEDAFLNWIVDFDFAAKGENKALKDAALSVSHLEGFISDLNRKLNNLIKNLEDTGATALAGRIKELSEEKTKAEDRLEKENVIFLDLREKHETISSEQGEFRETVKDPAARERLKAELRKRVERILMVFDANRPAGGAEDVYADGRRFARVKLINGESWDIFEDGEAVHYQGGRRWQSAGL